MNQYAPFMWWKTEKKNKQNPIYIYNVFIVVIYKFLILNVYLLQMRNRCLSSRRQSIRNVKKRSVFFYENQWYLSVEVYASDWIVLQRQCEGCDFTLALTYRPCQSDFNFPDISLYKNTSSFFYVGYCLRLDNRCMKYEGTSDDSWKNQKKKKRIISSVEQKQYRNRKIRKW